MFPDRIFLLAEKIRAMFGRGLEISAASLQYIDTTFSFPTAAGVEAICADYDNCERDSLLELLFFPDHASQLALEDTLTRWHYEDKDPAALIDCLRRRPLSVELRFPDGRGSFSINLPDNALESFVARLHITRQVDWRLAQALAASLPEDLQSAVKIRLRNAGIDQTTTVVDFLIRFFKNFDRQSANFLSRTDFVLAFLAEKHPTNNLFDALATRKRLFLKMLQQADTQAKQLQRHNMETLVLQGARICQADRGEIVRRIALIDTVCLSVYGVAAMGTTDPQPVTLALSPKSSDLFGTIGQLLRGKKI